MKWEMTSFFCPRETISDRVEIENEVNTVLSFVLIVLNWNRFQQATLGQYLATVHTENSKYVC